MEIIPALIADDNDAANDFAEIKERFYRVEPFLSEFDNWVQLDITDGIFVPQKTNLSDEEIKFFTERANVDLHLMAENPEENIEKWLSLSPKRITFHIEATKNPKEIIEKCHFAGIEVGIALNPKTPLDIVSGLLPLVDLLLFMGVRPGRGGQKFLPEVLEKIKSLSQAPDSVKIAVDGGINPEIAQTLKRYNIQIMVAGSYLFSSGNIKEAVDNLKGL